MYIKINISGENKGSVYHLADYLEKDESTTFLDKDGREVTPEEVISGINGNTQGLGREDAKFYMLSINPSTDELNFIKEGEAVDSFDKLKPEEIAKLDECMKSYVQRVMDNYAMNFNRKNVLGREDLAYYVKIERERHYQHLDKEVVSGCKRPGDKKEGLNIHAHVIVSRKSRTGAKLSPNTRFRNKKFIQGGKEITRGFDYTRFIDKSLQDFSSMTGYKYPMPVWENKKEIFTFTQDKSNRSGQHIGKQAVRQLVGVELQEEMKLFGTAKRAVSAIKMLSNPTPAGLAQSAVTKAIQLVISTGKEI